MKLPHHESFLFWHFAFNRAKTCAKSQFAPLNQKLIMPKSGIMVNFQLMLANYPTFVTLSCLCTRLMGYDCLICIGRSWFNYLKTVSRAKKGGTQWNSFEF
ncbi:hypothetical protein GBP07_08800 [Pediococcus acidilactici]|nr:hypothetical protein GBO52_02675 [Pediococcus acidilactici]KAF0465901.1 hypothetical protein GBP04_04585 [Pediococcus acidilactici]KAF0469719.1 hypothetical protein GBP07_08800 [Pediococcus acidilactici]KAF0488579.1 hypothetical protein GBP18_09440 [Pediococcus acidilactici]KAF0488621.1 hypothetical protein GBP15_08525 [Pediococcus acidilactici]